MQLSELSRQTGVSVASIKYYQREGLLAAGVPVSARKAEYGEEHVRRLRLIRAMLTTGGMSVSQVRDVLAVAEDPAFTRHERIGIAQYMLPGAEPPPEEDPQSPEWLAIREQIAARLRALDWRFDDNSPALDTMARSVLTLRALGYPWHPELLDRYAEVLRPIAEQEYAVIEQYPMLEDAIEAMIAYTVLLEPALAALRRLAHEDVSIRRHYGPESPPAWQRCQAQASPDGDSAGEAASGAPEPD